MGILNIYRSAILTPPSASSQRSIGRWRDWCDSRSRPPPPLPWPRPHAHPLLARGRLRELPDLQPSHPGTSGDPPHQARCDGIPSGLAAQVLVSKSGPRSVHLRLVDGARPSWPQRVGPAGAPPGYPPSVFQSLRCGRGARAPADPASVASPEALRRDGMTVATGSTRDRPNGATGDSPGQAPARTELALGPWPGSFRAL